MSFKFFAETTARLILATIAGYVFLVAYGQSAAAGKLLELVPGLIGFLVAVLAAWEADRRRRESERRGPHA